MGCQYQDFGNLNVSRRIGCKDSYVSNVIASERLDALVDVGSTRRMLRAVRIRRSPFSANLRAQASPMPLDAPVISTVFFIESSDGEYQYKTASWSGKLGIEQQVTT